MDYFNEIFLYKIKKCAIIQKLSLHSAYGGVAQLGERTVRIRKVKGSNPSVSTKEKDRPFGLSQTVDKPAFGLGRERVYCINVENLGE